VGSARASAGPEQATEDLRCEAANLGFPFPGPVTRPSDRRPDPGLTQAMSITNVTPRLLEPGHWVEWLSDRTWEVTPLGPV
jgi:hypothetical protein